MKQILKNLFLFISKPIHNILMLGVEGNPNTFDNRITRITNFTSLWSHITILVMGLTLQSSEEVLTYYKYTYAIVFVFCTTTLLLNYKGWTAAARITTSLTFLGAGWQAAIFYGKSFNGYLIFFATLIFPLICLHSKRSYKWILTLAPLFSLLLNDYLSLKGILPLTNLNSRDFPVHVLWIDTFSISLFIILLVYIERKHSTRYEQSLETLNVDLENQVHKRTEMLLSAKEESFHASLMKAQFVANTSHEIRTPLQGILGYSELSQSYAEKLEEFSSTEEQKLYIRKLKKSLSSLNTSSERMRTLVERLLDLAKTEDVNFAPKPCEFILEDIIIKSQAELKQNPYYNEILFTEDQNLSQILCNSDPILVQQVISNLLENALKYCDKGTPIRCHLSIDNGFVSFSISNQGPGIPSNEVDKIFDPFVQGRLTDKGVGGTGLGLSLCKKYAQALKGQVFLKDPTPDNTTFVFIFPKNFSPPQSDLGPPMG